MMVLQSLGPQFLQQFPDIALELSPLPNSVKKPMLDKIKQKQNTPPPPDPKIVAQGQMRQMELSAEAQNTAADNSLEWRKAQLQALTQIEVARISAKTDQDSSILASKLEAILGFGQMLHTQQENAADREHEQILAARQVAQQSASQSQQAA